MNDAQFIKQLEAKEKITEENKTRKPNVKTKFRKESEKFKLNSCAEVWIIELKSPQGKFPGKNGGVTTVPLKYHTPQTEFYQVR